MAYDIKISEWRIIKDITFDFDVPSLTGIFYLTVFEYEGTEYCIQHSCITKPYFEDTWFSVTPLLSSTLHRSMANIELRYTGAVRRSRRNALFVSDLTKYYLKNGVLI